MGLQNIGGRVFWDLGISASPGYEDMRCCILCSFVCICIFICILEDYHRLAVWDLGIRGSRRL